MRTLCDLLVFEIFEMWRHLETGLGILWRVGGSGDGEI